MVSTVTSRRYPYVPLRACIIVGVYGTAPLYGRLVDARGPRTLLVIAFVCLIVGYSGVRYFHDRGLPEGATEISTLSFCLLVACGFLTGSGGNGGLAGALNATAKSFPDRLVSVQCCVHGSLAHKHSLCSACQCDWSRDLRVWSLCVRILNYRPCYLPGGHLRVLTCVGHRHFPPDGRRIFLRQTSSVTTL